MSRTKFFVNKLKYHVFAAAIDYYELLRHINNQPLINLIVT